MIFNGDLSGVGVGSAFAAGSLNGLVHESFVVLLTTVGTSALLLLLFLLLNFGGLGTNFTGTSEGTVNLT